jgi:hypothetical protein
MYEIFPDITGRYLTFDTDKESSVIIFTDSKYSYSLKLETSIDKGLYNFQAD